MPLSVRKYLWFKLRQCNLARHRGYGMRRAGEMIANKDRAKKVIAGAKHDELRGEGSIPCQCR